MYSDPVADMLTRVRNALKVERNVVKVPYSQLKARIADVLKREGYIWDYEVVEEGKFKAINILLKYGPRGERVIQHIQKVSKPGRRYFSGPKDLRPVLNGFGISILSTNQGVLSDREARKNNVGGEVICEVW
ncbi:MAG: 30S ribosomal protein S8 [Thermoguttaceae bacterium]|nr:30S ribosomal protein S8 [Thermoguttaceae bacterium]